MPSVTGTKYYPWFVVAVLIVVYTSNFIDRTIVSLLVQPIRADLDITDTQYSLLAGFAFGVLYTFGGIPMGWIADHGSRRMLITAGCAVWSFMTALCGMANSFASLFAARVGVGIGEATLSPSAYSLMADYFPKDRLARAMSLYTLGVPLGSGLALIIGGSVLDLVTARGQWDLPLVGVAQPWQVVFFAIGLPGLLLALLIPILIREPARRVEPKLRGPSEIPTVRQTISYLWSRRGIYASLIGAVSFAALASFATNAWMPSFLQRVHGFSPGEAGRFLGFATLLLGVPGALCAGFLTDYLLARNYKDAHIRVGFIYVTGIFVCGALGPIMPVPGLSFAMVAGLGFFVFTWTGVSGALLQVITPNRMRGQISAFYLFVINIVGIGIGPTAVGICTDYIFADDKAVGRSLALVGTAAFLPAIYCLHRVRRHLHRSEFDI